MDRVSETPVSPVRAARLALELRLVDVCASAGISPGMLSMVERGYMASARTRGRIAGALGRPPEAFWPEGAS